jgi:hypothetical protein
MFCRYILSIYSDFNFTQYLVGQIFVRPRSAAPDDCHYLKYWLGIPGRAHVVCRCVGQVSRD